MNRFLARLLIDHRSLALFRILLSLALVVDSWSHGGIAGSLAIAVGLLLMLGFRSSSSAFAAWLAAGVLHAAQGEALHGTTMLSALLLIAVFVPIGAVYSVDAAMDTQNRPDARRDDAPLPPSGHGDSFATQILSVLILVSAVFAAQRFFPATVEQLFPMILPGILGLVLPVVVLLRAGEGWLTTSALLALLILIPAVTPAGISTTRYLVAAAGLTALIPAGAWEWASAVTRASHEGKLMIYYDRDCGFCRKTCFLIRTFLGLGETPIIPAQSDAEANEIMEREVSWVVLDVDGKPFLRWHALVLLIRRSPVAWPVGWLFTVIGMGYWFDPVYRVIGASRSWLSRLTAILLPYRRERPPTGSLARLVVGAWLLAAIALAMLSLFGVYPDTWSDQVLVRFLGMSHSPELW